jgi:hypothetical protein
VHEALHGVGVRQRGVVAGQERGIHALLGGLAGAREPSLPAGREREQVRQGHEHEADAEAAREAQAALGVVQAGFPAFERVLGGGEPPERLQQRRAGIVVQPVHDRRGLLDRRERRRDVAGVL